MPESPEAFLRRCGLSPATWEETLRAIETRLAPDRRPTFLRLHRAFAAYPAEHTCRAFYDFAAREDLLDLLAGFRFARLARIAADLATLDLAGRRVLDVGAGGGYLARYLRDSLGAEVATTDSSGETRARLRALGFPAFADARDAGTGAPFDRILCCDSLGEVNADEDGWLSDPGNGEAAEYPVELEARYGLASKLEPFKPLLARDGAVVLHEPIPHAHFWRGAARALERAGWRTRLRDGASGWSLRMTPAHEAPDVGAA